MFRNTIHTFMAVNSTGLNKVPVNGIIQVVDANSSGALNPVAFIQLTSTAGISAGNTIQQLLDGVVGDYRDIVSADAGGSAYDDTTDYKVGDIVTISQGSIPESFLTYVCITDCGPELFNNINWRDFAEDLEIAGTKWHPNKNYKRGVIVTQASTGDVSSQESYVALEDSINVNPTVPMLPSDTKIWKLLANEYFVEDFTPSGGTEYPTITTDLLPGGVSPRFLGQPGAYWNISGLTTVGYLMSTPNSTLLGQHVYNGDTLIWNGYDGSDSLNFDDLWVLKQNNTKRSSNIFDENENYLSGALVTYNNKIYIASVQIDKNILTPDINANWNLFDQEEVMPAGLPGQILEYSGTLWEPVDKFNLDELSNVNILASANKDTLLYDGVNWGNVSTSTLASSINLSDLQDISLPPATNTDSIKWNDTSSTWEYYTPITNLSDAGDVDVTTTPIANGNILQHNGTNWVNVPGADILTLGELNDLSDVVTTGAIANNILSYDGTAWISAAPAVPRGKEWSPVQNYLIGDVISQDGVIFTALIDNNNSDPIDNITGDYDLVTWSTDKLIAGAAVADSTGVDAAANALTINELLTSLRTAGVILP